MSLESLKSAAFSRTGTWRPATAPVRTLLRCGILSLLGLSAYSTLRLAWADHLSLSNSLAGRDRAVELAPAIANLYERLADKRSDLGSPILADLQKAVSLDPENPARRMHLGIQAELAGNFPLAEASLIAAAARSRLYQPRYLLAQYYFRRENSEGFWRWSRAALETAYGDVATLLDLNWRMAPDGLWIWQHAIPARPEIQRQFLVFLAGKRQWEAARMVAQGISTSATAADRPILLDYCDRRLAAGDGPDATAVWNTLCRRGLLPYRPLDAIQGPFVTDGSFEHSPLDSGFAWRSNNPPGVTCALRNHEIRLNFSGSQQEQCTILWQYIPVEPEQRYQLKFSVRDSDSSNVKGIEWSVSGLSEIRMDHQAEALRFDSGRNSMLKLALAYRRPLGSTPLEGAIAITGLRMERLR